MPQVQMGNATPHSTIVDHNEPCVYSWGVPDAAGYDHGYDAEDERPDGKDALIHVLTNATPHLPGYEAFVSIVTDWPHHSPNPPTWVWSDDDDLADMLAEAYGCPVGIPDDVEATHHTMSGPPGVGPTSEV